MSRKFWEAANAAESATALQNFVNSWQALPYTVYNYKITDEAILELRGDYLRGVIPFAADDLLYTCMSFDPGEKMTHWVYSAIGKGGKLAVVDYGTLTSLEDVLPHFRGYTAMLGDCPTPADLGYIDSGDQTMLCYDIAQQSGGNLLPTKGSTASIGTWGRTALKTHEELDLITYRDFALKQSLYHTKIKERYGAPLTIPKDVDKEFIDGLSGQSLVRKNGRLEFKRVLSDHYRGLREIGGTLYMDFCP